MAGIERHFVNGETNAKAGTLDATARLLDLEVVKTSSKKRG